MTKSILQIENTNASDFKKEILEDVKGVFQNFADTLQSGDSEKLLTREETADLLSISLVTLWDWTKKDLIPSYRIGTKIRYKKSEVLSSLQKSNNLNSSTKKQ
ncbi:helix-turn-helix domain-containing protein [Flavobacterium sp.]|uniref:helix-turn-helix domain-containing protein n=1 Tax=Flavobacterium sp. TaxID=239 RepID=UPI00262977C4|nr:helix-turn-helix domain-containing protein [Flavobacterium sp.]